MKFEKLSQFIIVISVFLYFIIFQFLFVRLKNYYLELFSFIVVKFLMIVIVSESFELTADSAQRRARFFGMCVLNCYHYRYYW